MELTWNHIIAAFIAAMSIPGAITGFIVWGFQRKIEKRDRQREAEDMERREQEAEREKARENLEVLNVQGTLAAIALAEATARAVERIPDTHCNGDMHDALKYATDVKHNIRMFLGQEGIKAVVK